VDVTEEGTSMNDENKKKAGGRLPAIKAIGFL